MSSLSSTSGEVDDRRWTAGSQGAPGVGEFDFVSRFFAPSLGRGILYGAIAIVVGAIYGITMLTGIFAAGTNVSWQAHLGGAVGGAIAAYVLRPKRAVVGSA